jgi:hypothetical protein
MTRDVCESVATHGHPKWKCYHGMARLTKDQYIIHWKFTDVIRSHDQPVAPAQKESPKCLSVPFFGGGDTGIMALQPD